ncbi:MAG: Short chain fatty acid transporter, partial [Firmicutes bacterium]|nr:Short chain fatty acid transporter [Bacillota bacterium]
MAQPNNLKSAPEEEQGTLARMGAALADWSEKWFPDAYVFAVIAVAIVVLGALAMGRTPMKIATDFGNGFWTLIPFTMQMAFVVIGGYIVAVSKPVQKFIIMLACVPKTPKVAVAYVAFMAMLASLLSWGFSLIFGGFLMREVARRVPNVDFRAISAAGYLGLGSVWALGLSSSAALLMVTKASIPPAMYKISG